MCIEKTNSVHGKHQSPRVRRRGLTVLVAALVAGPAAGASMPPGLDVFDHAEEIPDSELASIRGKFVDTRAGSVTYFGVEMTTVWQAGNGQTLTAATQVNMQFGPRVEDTLVEITPTVSATDDGMSSASSGPTPTGERSATGGLANTRGATQSIQVAGDANQVEQTARIFLERGNNADLLPSLGNMPSDIASTMTVVGPDGTTASAGLLADGVGIDVQIPNQGDVRQRLADRGILQQTRLVGDHNAINNAMVLRARLQDLAQSEAQVHRSLRRLQELGVGGL